MNKYALITVFASVLSMIASGAPNKITQPSPDKTRQIEKAAPAKATPSAQLKESDLNQSRTTAFATGMQSIFTELATYTLSKNVSLAQQIDTFVDEHLLAPRSQRDAISIELTKVAANPQATLDGRALACRKLSLIGSDNAVATLAKLIDDKAMGNWARYALARTPGKAADKALIEALKRTRGQNRLAVAALTGERRLTAALPALDKLAASNDAATVVAVKAIGQIGGGNAVEILAKLQPRVKGSTRLAVDQALLNCGESAQLDGRSAVAAKAYALLLSVKSAEHIRGAAFYGVNLSGGSKGISAAMTALKSTNKEIARAGARLIRDMPNKSIVATAAATLKDMSQDNQIITLAALSARGDRAAQDGVLALVTSESVDVRIAALQALGRLGDRESVKIVVSVASTPKIDKASRNAARKTINTMNDPGINKAIAAAMHSADIKTKTEYAKALGARKAHDALNILLAAARDPDATLAGEARKSISLLAQADDLPKIVALLIDTSDTSALRHLESIIVKAAKTTENKQLKTAAILNGLKQNIPVNARCALLTTLGRIGVSSTLSTLLSAFKESDTTVRRAALKVTAEHWPDAEPLLALRDASRSDQDEQCRVQALQGYARMLTMPGKRPVKDTIELYREALNLAKGTPEKRALIEGLESLVHKNTLALVTPFLKDSSVQRDALRASLSITKGLNGSAIELTGSVTGAEGNALDGNPKTRWTTGAAMRGGEWFMVDLGYEDEIRTIHLDAGPVGSDYPRSCEIYISLDGKNWGEPVAKEGDPKKRVYTMTFAPKYGRFIKLIQTGVTSSFWSINEIRINGVPNLKSYPKLNRANWKVSASRSPANDKPENAIDGDISKRWGTGGVMQPDDWFAVDLGGEHTVHTIVMNSAKSGSDYPREYQIYTSMDGKKWYGPVGIGKGNGALTKASLLPVKARHVKIVQTGSTEYNWWSIYDLQIMGE